MLGGLLAVARPVHSLAALRRLLALLIGIGAATAFTAVPTRLLAFGADASVAWGLPIPGGVIVAVLLLSASASQDSIAIISARGLPTLPIHARAVSNGVVWAGIAMLGVAFTAPAFAAVPGGPFVAALVLGVGIGALTVVLHRSAIAHESYRTFNLVAMLLAVGSLASMAITPTGEWWTVNFSTLGTSDDLAAACFNVAIVIAGLGMAGLAPVLSRELVGRHHGPRRGGALALRVLIAAIGLSLAGVGLVPIDRDPEVHNVFACAAAGAFAIATIGMAWWVRRPPKRFLVWSYASLAIEIAAMVGYDGLDLFNLTVFEIIAFSLVFGWLIAMVATTAGHPRSVRRSSRGRSDRHRAMNRMPRRAASRPPASNGRGTRPSPREHAAARRRRIIRSRGRRERRASAEEPP
ncbi:hypothetical protein FLP10_06830 [Agromyces intestinalis]|uniref:DUF998 domain-containing protein n=1 Tax=Agromyces intestinalis TaxID=2592652 RepID=A0A5C1YDH9_9MICO|nr:DUF998 domain-containing protein [Agromyces intestinalis]QEO14163.1 hypothetical protein FLP10_06830 [Agromyces intestinalis]